MAVIDDILQVCCAPLIGSPYRAVTNRGVGPLAKGYDKIPT